VLGEALATAQETRDDRVIARAMLELGRWEGSDLASWYPATGRQLTERALALYRRLGDLWGIAECLCSLAYQAYWVEEPGAARAFAREALATGRKSGDRRGIAFALEILGFMASAEDPAAGRAYLEESLGLYHEIGDLTGVASDENHLGRLDLLHRRYLAARDHYRASLRLTKDWGWVERITESLDGLANVAATLGHVARAMCLAGAGAHLREVAAQHPWPLKEAELERALAPIRQAGEPATMAAWAEGQVMPLEQAVEYALSDDQPEC
jgi:hypothetical protein